MASSTLTFPFEYDLAPGPEALMHLLESYLTAVEKDQAFSGTPRYILYKMGAQESVIKVDTSQRPFQFWYCDLQGRPMTMSVKAVIADFLWEKCGGKERYPDHDESEEG